MREILFRAKREDNGEWVYGYYAHLPDAAGSVHIMYVPAANPDERNGAQYIDPETVGEFTSLTDENGVKIFEGDIIRRQRADGNWYNYEVFWWDNCWGIKNGVSQCLIIPQCGVQLSGNIHDNPELLGDKDT